MPLMWMNQAALDARYVLRGEGSVQQDNTILRPNSDGNAFIIKNVAGASQLTFNTSTAKLSVTGDASDFGRGALGATGTYIQVGHLDDTHALINAAGSGSILDLVLRSKSTGNIILQDGNGAEILYCNKVRGLRIGSAVSQPTSTTEFVHLAMANIGTAITDTPTDGGWLFVQAGALKYKGSSGTVTTLGNA